MPNHGCFRCGGLLDDTCGKDAKGQWLCGRCWEQRSVVEANVALHKDTSEGLQKYRRWEWIAAVAAIVAAGVLRLLFGGRGRGWFRRR